MSEPRDLGGAPAFPEPVHVGRPNIGDRDRLMERIEGVIDRRWLTNDGPLVHEFEQAITELLGVPHCIAMCNGTVALEIAIRAAGLSGEVIVSPFTFVATAHALQWQEITPVFCDIDPRTHNIDLARLVELITPRTTGILGVHVWGRPAPGRRAGADGREHGLRLLFDAAHALGCSTPGGWSAASKPPRCSASTPPRSGTASRAAPSSLPTRASRTGAADAQPRVRTTTRSVTSARTAR